MPLRRLPHSWVRPPSTLMVSPVRNDAAGEARKITVAATSSQRPGRPMVTVAGSRSLGAGPIRPALTVLTWTPAGASSRASALDSPKIPARQAARARPEAAVGRLPSNEDTLTTQPERRERIPGSTALQAWKITERVASSCCHAWRVPSPAAVTSAPVQGGRFTSTSTLGTLAMAWSRACARVVWSAAAASGGGGVTVATPLARCAAHAPATADRRGSSGPTSSTCPPGRPDRPSRVAIRASLRRRDPFVGDGLGASSADAAIGEPASGRLDGSGHTGLQAEERDRIVELGAPAAADQHDIAGADLDAGRAFGAGQVVRRDPVAGGQDVGAVQGGDVQQHAAADHRLELVDPEHGEPAAGLRLGGRDAAVELALVGNVAEGVDVGAGVAAGD